MADGKRIILYGLLFFILLSLWQAWHHEHAQVETRSAIPSPVTTEEVTPKQGLTTAPNVAPTAVGSQTEKLLTVTPASRIITVKTDNFNIKIDTLGGTIIGASLLNYPVSLDKKDTPVQLLFERDGERYVAESGLNNQSPIRFRASDTHFTMADDQNTLKVELLGRDKHGVFVTKTFTFKRGDYAVGVSYQVRNEKEKIWQGQIYSQLTRSKPESHSSFFGISSYTGAAVSAPGDKTYKKVSFSDMEEKPLREETKGGWVAMQQHYFLSAWLPKNDVKHKLYSHESNGLYTIGMLTAPFSVEPGQMVTINKTLYLGPEVASTLRDLAPGLDLTIDYGWLWFISGALFWLMQHIYFIVGNWGWSIVLVTLMIKIVFHPLSAMSYRSMAAMKKMQPKIEQLKKRYENDKAKFSEEMMKLYQKEKINPLGGCLPMLAQIPFFIALYWVLLESVELRQAPFMFWIQDLSIADPYYVLPILMGISMVAQQWLAPAAADEMQAKMMMYFMPAIFTVLFINFPAGLVLYWLVNNLVSIAQQWWITQRFEASPPKKSMKRAR